jgi:hypothetical protein
MSRASNRLPSAKELAHLLIERLDDLVPTLLPGARLNGGYWHAGNVAGEEGKSLYVYRSGARAGHWSDAAGGPQDFGDLLDLIRIVACNGDGKRAMGWASSYLDLAPGEAVVDRDLAKVIAEAKRKREAEDARKIKQAQALWRQGQPIAGTLAELYLRQRGVTIALPGTLRFHPNLKYVESGQQFPAVLAAISGRGGVTAVQRIYIGPDGRKADVKHPKMTLGRPGNGACRLGVGGKLLGIAEGVETALSARQMFDLLPVWAACGPNLASIAIPDSVDHLTIFADNGAPGRKIAERALAAHSRPGREVLIQYPDKEFGDFNDMLCARKARAA